MWYDAIIKDVCSFVRKGAKDLRRKKPSEIIRIATSTVVPIGVSVAAAAAFASNGIKYIVTVTQNGKPIEVDIYINPYIISPIISLFALSVVLCIFSLYWREATTRQLKKLVNKVRSQRNRNSKYLIDLRSQYDHVLRQAGLVRSQGVEDPLNYNFTKMHLLYDINENGDASIKMNVTIQAIQEYVGNWLLYVDASPSGESLLLATHINLSVQCSDDSKCAVIPIRDGLQRKDFLIFFLPRIMPRQSKEIAINYSWPKMFSGLKNSSSAFKVGSEEVYWRNAGRARNKTCDFRLEMNISSKLGEISANLTGAKPRNGRLEVTSDMSATIVVYEVADMPCASEEYKLELSSRQISS